MTNKLALLLGFSSVSLSVNAQAAEAPPKNGERWMLYQRGASDGRPLVVIARTGNVEAQTLLLNGRATVVVCRTDPSNVNDQGMPQGTDRLYPIEDKLDEELPAAGAIRIASVTGQGQRRMFFVHNGPLDLPPMLQTIRVSGFACDASEVGDRQALIQLVTPTRLESQFNGDQEVIANLQKSGDDGHTPRKTDFWFYGQRGPLGLLTANLKAHGFSLDHWLKSPTGVVLSRKMPVDFAAFQALTPVIVGAAEQSGIEYDGWETLVVTKDSTQSNGRQDN